MLLVNCYLDKDGKHYQIDENGVVTERTKLPTNITGGHFEANDKGEWSYITEQGEKLTGFQYVDGVELYFDKDGKQLKGQEITVDGKTLLLRSKHRCPSQKILTVIGLKNRLSHGIKQTTFTILVTSTEMAYVPQVSLKQHLVSFTILMKW